jgi:hypothetical protein
VPEVCVGKVLFQHLIDRFFASVPKGSVSKIVAKPDRFGKVFIETKRSRNDSGDLGDLEGMGKSGAVVILFGVDKNLGFMLQTAKSFAMQHSVPIPLECGSERVWFFRRLPPTRFGAFGCKGGKIFTFELFCRNAESMERYWIFLLVHDSFYPSLQKSKSIVFFKEIVLIDINRSFFRGYHESDVDDRFFLLKTRFSDENFLYK